MRAKWTPAQDGGSARFSKKYRDAAGIDDSKYYELQQQTTNYPHNLVAHLLPNDAKGWALAAIALAALLVVLRPRVANRLARRDAARQLGGRAKRAPTAAEAARTAFLQKYNLK